MALVGVTNLTAPKTYKKILVIPDIHFPFSDWKAIKKIHAWKVKNRPDLIVFLGDVLDAKAWSRYPKDTDDLSAQAEFDAAEADMKKLHKLFPKAILLMGNHDVRAMSKALEVHLPKQLINSLQDVFAFKGWVWHTHTKPLVINTPSGKVAFMHGDEIQGTPSQKASKLGMSVVHGHTHKASLSYVDTFTHQVYGMECGHVSDPDSKGMRYAVKNPVTSWLGFATIIDGVPALIPLSKA